MFYRINLKYSLITFLLSLNALSFANYSGDLSQLKSTPFSSDEVLKIIKNPQNQNNVELVMAVLKNIEDLNITEKDKKISFVDNFNTTDNIKSLVKISIENNISYSDHKRIDYGLYEYKKCYHTNYASTDDPKLPNYILFNNKCYYQEYYVC